jgi:SAM-dependent methyltransferase
MNIPEIIYKSEKPDLYEKGGAVMWTDPYISAQLLETHLNPDLDLASRKPETIRQTIDWILSESGNQSLEILDLGCGPGLYSEILAGKGHQVTGVDFSENSIKYARKEAEKKRLDISYIRENYLELELEENTFDLVLLIFTDFGPLLPKERNQLLQMIRRVLKPGGFFIFDVLNEKNFEEKLSPRTWEVSDRGFWRNHPYLALSESFLYKEEKLILFQHLIIDEKGNIDTYRFWNHYFSEQDLKDILHSNAFDKISFHENVIQSADLYKAEEVTFCKALNN